MKDPLIYAVYLVPLVPQWALSVCGHNKHVIRLVVDEVFSAATAQSALGWTFARGIFKVADWHQLAALQLEFANGSARLAADSMSRLAQLTLQIDSEKVDSLPIE